MAYFCFKGLSNIPIFIITYIRAPIRICPNDTRVTIAQAGIAKCPVGNLSVKNFNLMGIMEKLT